VGRRKKDEMTERRQMTEQVTQSGAGDRSPTRPHLQSQITAFWDQPREHGREYDQMPFHGMNTDKEKQAWLESLLGLLPPLPADVLDVGTGTGFLALLAAELGFRATGIDLSEGMWKLAEAKAGAMESGPRFLAGDAVDPDFAPESFDCIVSRHLLGSLLEPDTAFANWLRVLRPGGRVVSIEWAADASRSTWKPYPEDVLKELPLRGAGAQELTTSFRRAGFVSSELENLDLIWKAEQHAFPDQQPRIRYAIVSMKA
jgi:ubiquinone/menaquinone biosynthesis C-methylase UbiE